MKIEKYYLNFICFDLRNLKIFYNTIFYFSFKIQLYNYFKKLII